MTRAQTKRVHVYGSYDAIAVFVFESMCVGFPVARWSYFCKKWKKTQAKTQN